MILWGHFVILDECELVTFKPQIMLRTLTLASKLPYLLFLDFLITSRELTISPLKSANLSVMLVSMFAILSSTDVSLDFR